MGLSLLILVATIATAVASPTNNENYLVMPHGPLTGSGACLSWRWAVETNNIRDYTNKIPRKCSDYIGSYMRGSQFRQDVKTVCDEAYEYAKGVNLTGDGNDVWIFDIDDTILSVLPYFEAKGTWIVKKPEYSEWTSIGDLPVIPEALDLYNKLIKLGFKIVFLTPMREEFRESRIKNLKEAGFTEWDKLLLKGENDPLGSEPFKSAKRKELEEAGYKICGNIGDQWTDITGTNVGDRTFKIPNPMYYIP